MGVFLSVVVSTAVLTGALIIGDSVRYTLMKMVDTRLGATQIALTPQQRFFSTELSNKLSKELDTLTASVLQLQGMITDGNNVKRVNRIEVLGVDEQFYGIAGVEGPFQNGWREEIILNKPLAERLDVGVNDEVVLRIEKPSLMSRDIVLTPDSDLSTAFRLKVGAIAGDKEFGRFSLQANQVAPLNVFVPMKWLQEEVGRNEQSNIILVAKNGQNDVTIDSADDAI